MKVNIKLLKPNAKIPSYGRKGDAGLDLYSCEDYELKPVERHSFGLGVAIELPRDLVALIWDRGGMAAKKGIHSIAGVIDSNYRGEVNVVLLNTSKELYKIKKGDRIAQMIVQKCEAVEFNQVDELKESERGDQGWFSSGK
ncbi:dUTP diphosphatase [Patescibacteria group bacterium]|nr:dUTP diphosphatase [Patescibacteria group bacterium]MBU0964087.1 dUTP diphosphatase [Patescibacteria group bacterium]